MTSDKILLVFYILLGYKIYLWDSLPIHEVDSVILKVHLNLGADSFLSREQIAVHDEDDQMDRHFDFSTTSLRIDKDKIFIGMKSASLTLDLSIIVKLRHKFLADVTEPSVFDLVQILYQFLLNIYQATTSCLKHYWILDNTIKYLSYLLYRGSSFTCVSSTCCL